MPQKDPASATSTAPGVAVGRLPDAELPDAELPDAELPDAELPDAELPDAPEAAQSAQPKPGVRSRVFARVKAPFRVARRRRVLIVGGAVLLVGLNVWMASAVDNWRGEDVALRADNEDLGMRLAQAQGVAAFQSEEIALVTNQATAAQAKADELAPLAEAQQGVADSLKAAGIALRQCVNDRGTLIANLWVSSASAQAGLEAQVNATCASAQAAFDAIPKEN